MAEPRTPIASIAPLAAPQRPPVKAQPHGTPLAFKAVLAAPQGTATQLPSRTNVHTHMKDSGLSIGAVVATSAEPAEATGGESSSTVAESASVAASSASGAVPNVAPKKPPPPLLPFSNAASSAGIPNAASSAGLAAGNIAWGKMPPPPLWGEMRSHWRLLQWGRMVIAHVSLHYSRARTQAFHTIIVERAAVAIAQAPARAAAGTGAEPAATTGAEPAEATSGESCHPTAPFQPTAPL